MCNLLSCVTVMFSRACSVIWFIWWLADRQDDDFTRSLRDDAAKVFESMGERLALGVGALDTYAVQAVSYAAATNKRWPFVQVPDYGVRVSKIRSQNKLKYVATYLYIDHNDRQEWELWSTFNNQWVNESIAVMKNDPTYHGQIINETQWTVRKELHAVEDRPELP